MTLLVENYTCNVCHNSKKQLKSTSFSLILAIGVALWSAVYPSVGEARGALMNLPSSNQETSAVAAPEPAKPTERPRAAEAALPRGASSGVVAMVTEAAERHGVPVALSPMRSSKSKAATIVALVRVTARLASARFCRQARAPKACRAISMNAGRASRPRCAISNTRSRSTARAAKRLPPITPACSGPAAAPDMAAGR